MINRIAIKKFKSLSSLEIPSIAPITLISGKNNIGKSNLLEAIFLFHDRYNTQMILNLLAFRGISFVNSNPESLWGSIFTDYNIEEEIEITLYKDALPEKLKIKLNPNYQAPPVQLNQVLNNNSIVQFGVGQSFHPASSLDLVFERSGQSRQVSHLVFNNGTLNMIYDFAIPKLYQATYIGARLRINLNDEANQFGRLDVKKEVADIIESLRIIEPRLEGLSTSVEGNTGVIYADIGRSRKIPLNLMGDGTSRLLSILMAIKENKNGLVLIDEIDNGYHYSTLSKMWNIIPMEALKNKCQIIATTHSYECIRSAAEGVSDEFSDKFKFIRLERNQGDKIIPRIFNIDTLRTSLEHEWEVR